MTNGKVRIIHLIVGLIKKILLYKNALFSAIWLKQKENKS